MCTAVYTDLYVPYARQVSSTVASETAQCPDGPTLMRGAFNSVAGAEATVMGYGTRRALVLMLLALYEARETKRARQSASLPCGCSAVHVEARIAKGR